ncbi:MAG: O-methyltransferase [Acidobacteriota bacterium]|nr:O-methyltransferase [Acidobacteriota bacterium]
MKDRPDAILRPEQAWYLDRILPPRDALLVEMEKNASAGEVPISDPEVGRLLGILARATKASRILEVGTAIGYGTLCLARGAPEATVTTIDRDPATLETARGYLERAGLRERVDFLEGEALEILPELQGPYDLLYLDGDKQSYRRCLDLGLQLLSVGGVVAIDNLLWKGHVADPPESEDAADDEVTELIAAFNGYLMIHPQLESLILPLGDGLGIATKTRPLVTDLGGPF